MAWGRLTRRQPSFSRWRSTVMSLSDWTHGVGTRTTATCGYEVTISCPTRRPERKKEREDKSHAAAQAVHSVFWPPQYCVEGLHSCIWANQWKPDFHLDALPLSLSRSLTNTQYDMSWPWLTKHTTASLILNYGSPSESSYTMLQKVACFASLLRRSRWPTNPVCTAFCF